MLEFNQWYEAIDAYLLELSDQSYQERVWVRGEEAVSSFDEAVNSLYDDLCMRDFLDQFADTFDDPRAVKETAARLETLIDGTDEFRPQGVIVASEEMSAIRTTAAQLRELLRHRRARPER